MIDSFYHSIDEITQYDQYEEIDATSQYEYNEIAETTHFNDDMLLGTASDLSLTQGSVPVYNCTLSNIEASPAIVSDLYEANNSVSEKIFIL